MKVLLVDQIAKVNYKYSYSLAEAISNEGNDVVLAVDQKKEKEKCHCKMINLFTTDEKEIGRSSKLKNYIDSYKKIANLMVKKKFDVLHVQWMIFSPLDYYYLKMIKNETGAKIVVTIHDILPFNKKFYDYTFHKKIYSLADEVIVQADNNVSRFDELFPKMAGKEVMIPHGHFLDYADLMDSKSARAYLGIPEDKTVLLFFGQIKKVKGVGVLLEAFSKLYKKYKDVYLIIAGSVWEDDFTSYQRIIDNNPNMDLSVRTDIRYIPDDEVKYYYSAADCAVLPYLDVYQSGVIQLSYAYKKPVIATRIGAFKEVVVENETGFMCEPDNAEDLSKTIEEAIQNKDRFDLMGKKGYEYIADKFSWVKIAKKVCKLYEN